MAENNVVKSSDSSSETLRGLEYLLGLVTFFGSWAYVFWFSNNNKLSSGSDCQMHSVFLRGLVLILSVYFLKGIDQVSRKLFNIKDLIIKNETSSERQQLHSTLHLDLLRFDDYVFPLDYQSNRLV